MKFVFSMFLMTSLVSSACGSGSPSTDSEVNAWFGNPGFVSGVAGCPKAPLLQGDTVSDRFFWKTRVTQQTYGTDAEGNSIGVELVDEVRRSWDPFNASGVDVRAQCSKVFTLDTAGQKVYAEAKWVPGRYFITSWQPALGYAVLQGAVGTWKAELSSIVYLNLTDGTRNVLASYNSSAAANDCPDQILSFVSPAGSSIALLTTKGDCGFMGGSQTSSLKFLDAAGQAKGSALNFDFTQRPFLTWTSETMADISDNVVHFEVTAP